jgi:tetratricopeptide (TPR) repeat protein
LFDPTALFLPLVLAYTALRAWRRHREYRRLVGAGSRPEPTRRRWTERVTMAVSALFCLALLAFKVVVTVEAARAAVPPGSPEWHARNAVALVRKATPQEMEQALRRAVKSWDKIPDEYDLAPEFRLMQGATCFDLAELHANRGEVAQADRLYRKALAAYQLAAARQRLPPEVLLSEARACIQVAAGELRHQKQAQAGLLYRRALAALEKADELSDLEPPLRLLRAVVRNDLGAVLLNQGQVKGAEPLLRQAASDCEELLRDHPGDPDVTRIKALAEDNLGRLRRRGDGR